MSTVRSVVRVLAITVLLMCIPAVTPMTANAAPAQLAELTIVSDSSALSQGESSGYFGGHTFLIVKNVSTTAQNFGRVGDVAPGESLSIGTWGNKSEHLGIWYNLESYLQKQDSSVYQDSISLTIKLNGQQLSKLNDYIRNHDSHGGDGAGAAYNNCSSFATGAWNSLVSWEWWVLAAIPPGFPTPTGAYYYIQQNGAHKSGFNAPWSGRGVYYANGKKAPTPSSSFIISQTPPVTNDVVGQGIQVTGSQTTGNETQWAHLDGLATNSKAWVLSTGNAADAVGTPSFNASTGLGGSGNDLLTNYVGTQTFDAASYKLTLKPSGTRLHVRYVFASEEYPEYVGSQYNDVMAVFVNGTNCARVPSTDLPVSVNSVNHNLNSQFYIDNSSGASGMYTTFDGLTTPLECTVEVVPGAEVTVEIAVADTGDSILDSGVALLDRGIWSD